MSTSIKLKNDMYLDSTGVVHNKELLSDILNALTKYKVGHARYGRSSNLYVPASTVTAYSLNKTISSDSAGMTSLTNGYVSFNKKVRFVIITIGTNHGASFNLYPSCFGSTHATSFASGTGQIHYCFVNTTGTAGTFSFSVFQGTSTTFDYDNYWNYVDINYLYEE